MKLSASFFVLLSSVLLMFFQFSTYNRSIETPTEVTRVLDSFIQNTPSLPRYVEGGYSPLGRSPVVDVLLADPLYMPKYAEIVTELIKTHSQQNQLFPLATSLLTAAGVPLSQFGKDDVLKFSSKIPERFQQSFPSSIAKKIYDYWLAFINIHQEVETILSVLSTEEKTWIKENYNSFFLVARIMTPITIFSQQKAPTL